MDDATITVDVHGVGYEVHVATSTHHQLPSVGEDILIHTYYQQKDDGVSLYGFMTKDELQLYKQLITVSGIGPKGGLMLLATLSPSALRYAIATEDIKSICQAQGVGKKTAQRLVLELKDKMKIENQIHEIMDGANVTLDLEPNQGECVEATTALTVLGYNKTDAEKAVKAIESWDNVEDLIKKALKRLVTVM